MDQNSILPLFFGFILKGHFFIGFVTLFAWQENPAKVKGR